MWRSGLLLIALFVAALLIERRLATQHQLRFAWGIALVLATGVTLSVGSVQGVAQAWRGRQPSPADPSSWKDGETVRVEGILRLRGADRAGHTTPFTGRPAAYLEYSAFAPREAGGVSRVRRPHWRGILAETLDLEIPTMRIQLLGMPPVRDWPEQQMSGPSWHEAAVRHLLATEWSAESLGDPANPGEGFAAFSAAGADSTGRIERHVMNREAADVLGLREDARPTDESLQRRIAERPWTFTERVVEPNVRVTVLGTFRSTPPRIDVGLSPLTPNHAVHLGAAAPLANREWRGTLLFALVLVALTIVGHVVVFGPAAAWLRQPA